MNKKRFLVEFDESLKTYKSLNITVPTVRIESQEDEQTDDWFCDECLSWYQDGENCDC